MVVPVTQAPFIKVSTFTGELDGGACMCVAHPIVRADPHVCVWNSSRCGSGVDFLHLCLCARWAGRQGW